MVKEIFGERENKMGLYGCGCFFVFSQFLGHFAETMGEVKTMVKLILLTFCMLNSPDLSAVPKINAGPALEYQNVLRKLPTDMRIKLNKGGVVVVNGQEPWWRQGKVKPKQLNVSGDWNPTSWDELVGTKDYLIPGHPGFYKYSKTKQRKFRTGARSIDPKFFWIYTRRYN